MEVALHLAVNGLADLDFVLPKFLEQFFHSFQKYKNVRYFAPMLVDQVKFSFKRKMVHGVSTGLVALLILFACQGDKKPAGILSEPEMVRVLSEIYLAEEKAGSMGITYDSTVKLFPKFF